MGEGKGVKGKVGGSISCGKGRVAKGRGVVHRGNPP